MNASTIQTRRIFRAIASLALGLSLLGCADPLTADPPKVANAGSVAPTDNTGASPSPTPAASPTPVPATPTPIPVSKVGLSMFSMTPLGTHRDDGGGCPSGYATSGAIADAGGAQVIGNQNFCTLSKTIHAGEPVIVDIKVTSPAASAAACPTGYVAAGMITNCEFAVCNTLQNVCVLSQPLTASSRPVISLSVTTEGTHSDSLACATGDPLVGITTDCGGGFCNGHQLFCLHH